MIATLAIPLLLTVSSPSNEIQQITHGSVEASDSKKHPHTLLDHLFHRRHKASSHDRYHHGRKGDQHGKHKGHDHN